jgi:hypothetical protein
MLHCTCPSFHFFLSLFFQDMEVAAMHDLRLHLCSTLLWCLACFQWNLPAESCSYPLTALVVAASSCNNASIHKIWQGVHLLLLNVIVIVIVAMTCHVTGIDTAGLAHR